MKERPKYIDDDEWVCFDQCSYGAQGYECDISTGRIRFRTKDVREFATKILSERTEGGTAYFYSLKASRYDIALVESCVRDVGDRKLLESLAAYMEADGFGPVEWDFSPEYH